MIALVLAAAVYVPIPGAAFEMARTEVTIEEFSAFVAATGHVTAAERARARLTWRTPGFRRERRQPVVHVTYADACAHCAWAGARLPTEAEWEYAARAGATTHHFWGEEIDGRYLWYRENSDGRPRRVATRRPNAWGLYDMEGNVWEWVASVEKAGYGSVRGGAWITCPEPYPEEPDRTGRQIGLGKPFPRGKSQHLPLDWRRDDAGFRCVRPRD